MMMMVSFRYRYQSNSPVLVARARAYTTYVVIFFKYFLYYDKDRLGGGGGGGGCDTTCERFSPSPLTLARCYRAHCRPLRGSLINPLTPPLIGPLGAAINFARPINLAARE